MAEGVAGSTEAGSNVNTTGNPTEIAMAYLQDEVTVHYFGCLAFCEGKTLKCFEELRESKVTNLI